MMLLRVEGECALEIVCKVLSPHISVLVAQSAGLSSHVWPKEGWKLSCVVISL
jgi:hypothetical protein